MGKLNETVCQILFILMAIALGFQFGALVMSQHVYGRSGVVTELDYQNDEVIWVDDVGFEWSFKEIDDWSVGDGVVVVNFDHYTESIYDDETVDIKYQIREEQK